MAVVESVGAAGAVAVESAGPGEVDCCFEQAARASALMHSRRRLRFIRSPHCMSSVKAAAAPLQCRVELNVPSQEVFRCRTAYFLAAMRFFFLTGSLGRVLPKEP